MKVGSEVFFKEPTRISKLRGKKVGFLGHAASVNASMINTYSLLQQHPDIQLLACFSPQHGFHGIRQANMLTHEDQDASFQEDVRHFSLYSQKTRRLTQDMQDTFEILLVDLQDVGCRIYTYLTSLLYILEDCPTKKILILDRPLPVGRNIEGSLLDPGFKSFVGHARTPMTYGLTLGEIALWYKDKNNLKVDLEVVRMQDYSTKDSWSLPWVLPSPNMPGLSCAECYGGTVLLEGTKISEGRGTTLPLETFGIPNMKTKKIKKMMQELAPAYLQACALREHEFMPQFDKFHKQVCQGFQIHITNPADARFQPYRLMAVFLKCFRKIHPEFEWILPPPYEYEFEKLPIDILSGSTYLREWIENDQASVQDLETHLQEGEQAWRDEIQTYLIYQ